MGFADRSRLGRARLFVELLEDRTTPATLDDTLSLALPQLAATGDRVNVVLASTDTSAADQARLAATPLAANVTPLGFGIYSVTLAPGADLSAALAFYDSSAGVLGAEPDAPIQVQRTPNDTNYSSLYGMTKIDAPTAWDTTTGSAAFAVGVIDTGIDYKHPDLYKNVWINQGEIPSTVRANLTDVDGDGVITFYDLNNSTNIGTGKITDQDADGRITGYDILRTTATGGWADGLDTDGNGYKDDLIGWNFVNNTNNPFDDNSHGTHVSGTIGAMGNNSLGVVGVNWSVEIAALKFLASDGSGYTSGAVSALNYAVNNGIKVTNNSWGGGGYSLSLATAIGRAQTAGDIFVAAAGNNSSNNDSIPSYPASYISTYDNVVTVAATTSSDTLASFSNYGANSVTLAAPGSSILSTTPNSSYASYSGTSMATPHVTGAIALYWAAHPDLDYSDVIAKLKSSVDVLSSLSGKVATGGRLNVGTMFADDTPAAAGPKVTSAVFSGSTTTQFDTLRVTFDSAIDANTFDASDIASFTGPDGAITTSYTITPVGTSGTQFDISFAAQTAAGSYSMTFGPDIRDTSNNPMNQNGNGTAGETPGDQFTATGSLVLNVSKTYSTGSIALAIRDFSTTTSTITVGDDLKITDLNVKVSLTHTYDSDLVITLTGPTGTVVTLFNRRGGSGDNLSGTTFDDEATTSIASGAAPFSGTYRPEGALSAFDKTSAKGTWTLRVSDRAFYDTGTLTNWSLTVNGTVGSSAAKVQALGFRDEPLHFATTDVIAEPVAVAAPEPTGPEAPALSTSDVVSALTPARGLFALLTSEADEPDAPLAGASAPRTEAGAPATHDDFEAPLAAAYAMLYLPPEETSDIDLFDVLAAE